MDVPDPVFPLFLAHVVPGVEGSSVHRPGGSVFVPCSNHKPEVRAGGLAIHGQELHALVRQALGARYDKFFPLPGRGLVLPRFGQVTVHERLEPEQRLLGFEELHGKVAPSAFPIRAVEARQVVRPHPGQRPLVLRDPLAMSEPGDLLGIGHVALAKLAFVAGGGSDTTEVPLAVLKFCGLVPFDLPPLQSDRCLAMRAWQIEPTLVAAEEPLPDAPIGGGRGRCQEQLGRTERLESLLGQVEGVGFPLGLRRELVHLVGHQHPHRARGEVCRAVAAHERQRRTVEVLFKVGELVLVLREVRHHSRAVFEHGHPPGFTERPGKVLGGHQPQRRARFGVNEPRKARHQGGCFAGLGAPAQGHFDDR